MDEDRDHYIHLVAVSQETGDTVNILTKSFHYLGGSPGDTVFNYFDQESVLVKMDEVKGQKYGDVIDPDTIQVKLLNKVARDPKFDMIADNDYPTVIDGIGKSYKPGTYSIPQ